MQCSQDLVPLQSEVTGGQICLPGCYRLPDSPQSFHSQLAKEKKKKGKENEAMLILHKSSGGASVSALLAAGGSSKTWQLLSPVNHVQTPLDKIRKKAPKQNEDKGPHGAWHILSSWLLQWGDKGQLLLNNLYLAAAKMKVPSALSF